MIDSYVRLTLALLAENKKVILALQSPRPPANIETILRKKENEFKTSIYGYSIKEWNQLYRNKDKLLSRLPSGVVVYDPVKDFCNDEGCYVVKDQKALFYDEHHPSLAGARLMSKGIMKLIKE